MLLFLLGAAHLAAAAAGPFLVAVPLDVARSPAPTLPPHLEWFVLIGVVGLPPLTIALRPRHRALGRPALARTAAALLLLGSASGVAGVRVAETAVVLGPMPWWPALPGATMAMVGTILIPLLALRPERRDGAREPPVVPRMSVVVALYGSLDWIVLRMCGVALLGAAWLLYARLTADASVEPLAPLLHGQAPDHAAVVYMAAGLFLLFPVAMPRALTRPATVTAGLAKAALLVGAAWIVRPVLPLLAETVAPGHADAILAIARRWTPVVIGGLVVAAVLLAFFRQMGGGTLATERRATPAPDASSLRALRAARMDR